MTRAGLICAAAFLLCGQAAAQFPYDVPYVPTPQVVADEMLRLAGVGPDDFVIDLGSGDGRIPITAAKKFGARALGVDLDERLALESIENARQAGVEDRVEFLRQDLFKTDLSRATVITMYLLPGVNHRLRDRLLALRPGTRIVSHDFDMEDWHPDDRTTIRKNTFLWIVPAQVAGRWRLRLALPDGERVFDVELSQRFQDIDGAVRAEGQIPSSLWEPRLRGGRISFIIVDAADREREASLYFTGRVVGDAMEGEAQRGVGSARTTVRWRAVRVGA